MKKIIKLTSIIPALIMACIIFGFSGQDGEASGGLSGKIAAVVYDALDNVGVHIAQNRTDGIEKLQYPIRKLAHMTEYAIFTAAIFLPCVVYGLNIHLKTWLPLIIAALYAAADEYHQTFIPGRYGCVTDVFIDSAGAAIMTCFIWLVSYYSKHKKDVKNTKDIKNKKSE